ncbi:MAG: DUF4031 domain-containing protein [Candidatus Edwardsbacteria bacterium]|nr:DUF4031 domain-containing protein [Candidatus Edwardsbacteria bacterium]
MVYTDGKHLVADYFQELLAFSKSIGLRPEWLQDRDNGHKHTHFDLTTPGMAEKALRYGARQVTSKEAVRISDNMNRYGEREYVITYELPGGKKLPVINSQTGQTNLF